MKRICILLAIMATTILCGCDQTEFDVSGKKVFAGFTYDISGWNVVVFHDKSKGEKVLYYFGDGDFDYHNPKDVFSHEYPQAGEYKVTVIAYEKGYNSSMGFVGDGKEFRTETTIKVE